jgi:hypothetical protein
LAPRVTRWVAVSEGEPMSTTNPLTGTDRQEFRARFPWRLYAVVWAMVVVAFGSCGAIWAVARAASPSAEFAKPLQYALALSVVPLFVLCGTGLGLLEARRASVVLDASGLAVTDWRRKQRRVPWGEVLWLETARWAGRSGGVMRVGTATGSVRFAYPIDRPEVLRQEIIRRAGLGEPEKGWLRFTYRRSRKATAPRSGDEGNEGSGD